MSKPQPDNIAELIQAVQSSQKYAAISEAMIRSIGMRELTARRNLKEAIKATKNKLHQVAGAYLDARLPYDDWLALLSETRRQRDKEREVQGEDAVDDSQFSILNSQFRQACLTIMRHHASTRERLPILESF